VGCRPSHVKVKERAGGRRESGEGK